MMSNEYLLDSSVLMALSNGNHTHHRLATRWLNSKSIRYATCPITQGAMVRNYFRQSPSPTMQEAHEMLEAMAEDRNHKFIPDDIDYRAVEGRGIRGHQQVTDAYLVYLAKHHKLKLATFDSAQAALYPDVVELLTGEL